MNILKITEQFDIVITAEDIICVLGLLLLGLWLLKTSFGRKALAGSPPRRNNMPFYLPFIPLFIWFGAVSLAIAIARKLLTDLLDFQSVLLDNVILCIGTIATTAITVFLVRGYFVRRLKGFGLNPKTIHKDFLAAFVNLLTIWPLVLLAITLTIFLGRLIWGPGFQMPQHQELISITEHPQLSVRTLIVITAVVIVPVFEEMLFRGLFQTMIRSYLMRPWLAVFISSLLFAVVHANLAHWLALFTLGICMGYSYEKSGSLLRPVFIHSLFNAASIITALNQ